jgi:hypothetical protein
MQFSSRTGHNVLDLFGGSGLKLIAVEQNHQYAFLMKLDGPYRREKLFKAARRTRAFAYLADDDHWPLALQEILLAGCPTVGVPTGMAFVRDGITGVLGRQVATRKAVRQK